MPRRLGSTILFAVLIVAITLATATTLASLIIRALERSSRLGESAVLLYAAESELERQLYAARKLKGEPSGEGSCTLTGWASPPTCTWVSAPESGFAYTATSRPSTPQRDQAVQVHVAVGNRDSMSLKTSCKDTVGGLAAWVEITRLRIGVDNAGATIWQVLEDPSSVYKQYYQCAGLFQSTLTPLTRDYHYMIRVRALYDSTTQLKLSTVDGSDVDTSGLIRGVQTLKVTALGGLAQQVVKATFLALPAAVGFTDYVLFSECSIKKGVAGGPTC